MPNRRTREEEIARKARDIVARAKAGGPAEDSFVEFKSELPQDLERAARQLGALANAARGGTILWLMGVREDGTVVGVSRVEQSRWWNAVRSRFDGPPPRLTTNLNLNFGGKTAIAMQFETQEFPYVVTKAVGTKEVPWREGNATRSCSREELLSLLTQSVQLPVIEVLSAYLHANQSGSPREWGVFFEATLYIKPRMTKSLTVPLHDCSGSFWMQGFIRRTPFKEVSLRNARNSDVHSYDVVLKRPEALCLNARTVMVRSHMIVGGEAQVEFIFQPVNSVRPLVVTTKVFLHSYREDGVCRNALDSLPDEPL